MKTKQIIREALIICLMAIPPAALAALVHPQRPNWILKAPQADEVHINLAKQWQDILWVDARSNTDFEEDHIPEAVLLNEDDWDELLPSLLERWQPGMKVIVYCDNRACGASHHVANRLRNEVGLHNVFVLKDGWVAWQKSL